MSMNWDDPAERLALMRRVGPTEYNRQIEQYHRDSTTNGVRQVNTRFGQLFIVVGTKTAFKTREEAEAAAGRIEPRTSIRSCGYQ